LFSFAELRDSFAIATFSFITFAAILFYLTSSKSSSDSSWDLNWF